MNELYYRWLIELLDDEYLRDHYKKLTEKLFETEFTWVLPFDENRAKDGLRLRKDFAKKMGLECQESPNLGAFEACSVLEMLIGLARRAENDILWNPDFGDHTGPLFWEMMENLHLDIYDDYNWFEDEVDEILEVFLERKYASDGDGNVFKLDRSDPRKIDLWLQLNRYIIEHEKI